jgi:hypothetical protein
MNCLFLIGKFKVLTIMSSQNEIITYLISSNEYKKEGIVNIWASWASVAHTCNPSYSESRDREDYGSKPVGQMILEAGLVEWLKKSTCLASVRPWVQTPVLPPPLQKWAKWKTNSKMVDTNLAVSVIT